MNGERNWADIGHFKNLFTRHSRMDEVGGGMNGETHAGKFAASLDPAADIVGKGKGFDSDSVY